MQHHGQKTGSVQFAQARFPDQRFVETVLEIQGAFVQRGDPVLADQAMKGHRLLVGPIIPKGKDVEVEKSWITNQLRTGASLSEGLAEIRNP